MMSPEEFPQTEKESASILQGVGIVGRSRFAPARSWPALRGLARRLLRPSE